MKAGASHGETSEGSADQTALANCRRNGPTDCKILTHASNRCLALALGSNRGSLATALDRIANRRRPQPWESVAPGAAAIAW
jgi:hypothetical protein